MAYWLGYALCLLISEGGLHHWQTIHQLLPAPSYSANSPASYQLPAFNIQLENKLAQFPANSQTPAISLCGYTCNGVDNPTILYLLEQVAPILD